MAHAFNVEQMIGRQEELAVADQLLRATVARGGSPEPQARALLIGGDAGIGKTTLVQALVSRATEHDLMVTVGHCLDIAVGAPFAPIVEALSSLVRRLPDGARTPTLARWLRSPTSAEAAPSLERLLASAESLALATPFVLVVEDIHWADESVRDWAVATIRTCRAPLLVVLTFRADDITRGHPLRPVLVNLTTSPGAVRLDLHGLQAEGIAQLARRHTGLDLRPEALASVVERSGGNPLFVTELLNADDQRPAVLHDLLLRHVDRLSDTAGRLCRLASIGGNIIDVDVVEDASGLDPDQFIAALQELLDANIVVRQADLFSFRHALLREAIHDNLLPATRGHLHAAYAAALSRRVDDGALADRWRLGTALCHHALSAHDLPLAFDASVSTGLAGLQFGAASAADRFEQAFQLWDLVPDAGRRSHLEKTDLLVLAARTLANEGLRERVHTLLRGAVDLLGDDSNGLAACRVWTAVGAEWSPIEGLPDQAAALDEAVRLAGDTPSRELSQALSAAAFHRSRYAQFRAALSLAERALRVAVDVGATDLTPEARWERSGALWCLGRCDEAMEANRAAIRDAERADLNGLALEIAGELAFNLLTTGAIDAGLELARRTRESAKYAGLTRLAAFAAEQEAEWLVADGRFDTASDLYRDECLPGTPGYRRTWIPVTLLLARGDGARALAIERGWVEEEHAPGPNLDHTPRLLLALEEVHDISGLVSATEDLLRSVRSSDSPVHLAQAAHHGFHALALARESGLTASAELAHLSEAAMAFARGGLSPQWRESWYGMHLAMATAHEVRLAGGSAVTEWQDAADLATTFGRYTALEPGLELARALLTHGSRDVGKERLVGLWHAARDIGAGWFADQAAVSARHFRVPLPLRRDVHSSSPLDRLTPREREVLTLVATGATDRDIAAALFITTKTASAHVGRVLAKLGVANRGQAAALMRSVEQATRHDASSPQDVTADTPSVVRRP